MTYITIRLDCTLHSEAVCKGEMEKAEGREIFYNKWGVHLILNNGESSTIFKYDH